MEVPIQIVKDDMQGVSYLQVAKDLLTLASNEPAVNKDQVEFYMRKAEVSALIAIAESNQKFIPPMQEFIRKDLRDAERSAAGWEETAQMHCKNEAYYRGLVERIGKLFGERAKTADNGDVMVDIICAKVPELVEELDADLKAAMNIASPLHSARFRKRT